jgi:hypothetical protein
MYGLIPPLVVRERKYAYYKYLELAQVKDNFIPLELFRFVGWSGSKV